MVPSKYLIEQINYSAIVYGSISIIATVNRTINSNNGGNRTINLFCRFLFVGLNISDRVCVVPCKSRNGVISFYGLPIEVFDTIPESALKLLILQDRRNPLIPYIPKKLQVPWKLPALFLIQTMFFILKLYQ